MMVEASKRATAASACLSRLTFILPQPLPEVEDILCIPLTRASIASSLLVAVISTTRAEVPPMPNHTENPGKVRDGFSFTGSNGTSASPTNATLIKATMSVKAEAFDDFLISEPISCMIHLSISQKKLLSDQSPSIKVETIRKRKLSSKIE